MTYDRTTKKHMVVVVEQKLCTFDKSNPKRHLEATLRMSHEKLHLRPDDKSPRTWQSCRRYNPKLGCGSRGGETTLFVAWGIDPPLDNPLVGGILNWSPETTH